MPRSEVAVGCRPKRRLFAPGWGRHNRRSDPVASGAGAVVVNYKLEGEAKGEHEVKEKVFYDIRELSEQFKVEIKYLQTDEKLLLAIAQQLCMISKHLEEQTVLCKAMFEGRQRFEDSVIKCRTEELEAKGNGK